MTIVLRLGRHVAVLAVCLFVVLGSASSAGALTIAEAEQSLLAAINEVRAGHHLRPLVRNGSLDNAAQDHSDAMIRHDYFGHAKSLGRLPGRVVGENLAYTRGRIRAHAIVASWLASSPHRANLLRPGFRRIGIGVAVGRLSGKRGTRVVTVDFSGR